MIPLGQVEKMQIQALTGPPPDGKPVGEPYKFLVNPANYKEKFSALYVEDHTPGNDGTELKYNGQGPSEWTFEILIDGTGVIKAPNALDFGVIGKVTKVNVAEEVKTLKSITLDKNSEIHRNNYLVISWGSRDVFKGSLVSLDLDYKLFTPQGTPLRVVATLVMHAWVKGEERKKIVGETSPDITHERVFKSSDKFTSMIGDIYRDPNHYISVAKANGMNGFRRIGVGSTIKFPPLK